MMEYEKKIFAMQEANAIMGETIKSQEAEIERLKAELAQSVKLPCKMGDMVFVPWDWDGEQGVAVANIEEIQIIDSQNRWMFFIDLQSDDEPFNQAFGRWKLGESIGGTVFLTREEAKKALAERRGKC